MNTAATTGQSGDVIDGRYLLKELSRAHPFDETWIATDISDSRSNQVGLSLPVRQWLNYPDVAAAFQNAYEIRRNFDHPKIEQVESFGFSEQQGIPYLVFAFAEGSPLSQVLKDQPSDGLPLAIAFDIAYQAAAALSYVHDCGYVRCDFKPANLFVGTDGAVKLCNFSIARSYRPSEFPILFDPGKLGALTPTYACVEMFDGENPDPRDDVYSLGIVLYQLFSMEYPFQGKSSLSAQDLGLKVERIECLNWMQNRAFRNALAFSRDKRTPTVEQVVAKLRAQSMLHKLMEWVKGKASDATRN